MDRKELFKKHRSRLVLQGWINSALVAICAGFAASFIVSFAAFFTALDGIWFAVAAGVVVMGAVTPLMYFLKYRPTDMEIMRRVDRLGLMERTVTMNELEGDTSYIALLQRDDARRHIEKADPKRIKIVVPTVAIIAASVIAFFGMSMTTVEALSKHTELIKPPIDYSEYEGEGKLEYITVSYLVDASGGGYIEGEADQILEIRKVRNEKTGEIEIVGADAQTVIAVAEEGWVFQYWLEDENENPSRTDKNITSDIYFTAVFAEAGEGEGEGEGQGEPGEGEGEPGEGEGEGEGEPGQPDNPSDNSGNGENQNPGEQGDGQGGGAGGQYEEKNQILDGETYYRDQYEKYYEEAVKKLQNGGELTPEERAIIESYFGSI